MTAQTLTQERSGGGLVACPVCQEGNNPGRGREACWRCGWRLFQEEPILVPDRERYEEDLAEARRLWRERQSEEQTRPPSPGSRLRTFVTRWRRRLEPLAAPIAGGVVLLAAAGAAVMLASAAWSGVQYLAEAAWAQAPVQSGTALVLVLAYWALLIGGLFAVLKEGAFGLLLFSYIILKSNISFLVVPIGFFATFLPSAIDDLVVTGGAKTAAAIEKVMAGDLDRLGRSVDWQPPGVRFPIPPLQRPGTPGGLGSGGLGSGGLGSGGLGSGGLGSGGLGSSGAGGLGSPSLDMLTRQGTGSAPPQVWLDGLDLFTVPSVAQVRSRIDTLFKADDASFETGVARLGRQVARLTPAEKQDLRLHVLTAYQMSARRQRILSTLSSISGLPSGEAPAFPRLGSPGGLTGAPRP